jgi:ankyrin repeat protein
MADGSRITRNEGLLRAAEQGDVETIRQMLDQGADVDSRRHNGWTALMPAAANGKTEAFELLLSQGADPHLTDGGGNTPLHHAACGGKVAIIRALIERGVDVDARSHRGWTPLHAAVFDERIRAVHCLIKAGADVNAQTEREIGAFTPLKGARGNSKMTDLLLAAGAKLDPYCDELIANALARVARARSEGHEPTFRQRAKDAFVQAAFYGQLEAVQSLLAAGMPVDACNEQEGAAIWHAAVKGHGDVFQTLLDAGATLETARPSGSPILVAAADGGSTVIVRLLLARGCDPNEAGADGFTPLMAATLGDHAAVVRILLDAGTDPHARGWSADPNKTALLLAQDNRKTSVIPLLADAMGLSPEHVAEDPAYAAARRLRNAADTPEFQAVLRRLAEVCGKRPIPWKKRKGVHCCYLRRATPEQVESLQAEVRAAGFQLVLYDTVPGFGNSAKLMVFPTAEKYAVLVARGTNGTNYGFTTRAVIAWLRNLEQENPFDLTACGFDFVEGRFRGPVVNAEAWADRMFEFCPDAGCLLQELRQGLFGFWWD